MRDFSRLSIGMSVVDPVRRLGFERLVRCHGGTVTLETFRLEDLRHALGFGMVVVVDDVARAVALLRAAPEGRVVMLGPDHHGALARCIVAGVRAYLIDGTSDIAILDALRRAGGDANPRAHRLAWALDRVARADLSPKEREVLAWLADSGGGSGLSRDSCAAIRARSRTTCAPSAASWPSRARETCWRSRGMRPSIGGSTTSDGGMRIALLAATRRTRVG